VIVGVLIIVWVVVLRNLYQKKLLEEQVKAGLAAPGATSFETLKKMLGEISEQLVSLENDCGRLAERVEGQRQ
jgi:hypothetical protein